MANNTETAYIRGEAHWAKVLGPPRKNNFDDYKEWTVDVSPDEEGIKLFKRLGIADRLKDPKGEDETRGRFITFRQKEERPDGTKNDPIRIVDANNQPWDERKLIGNGSKVDVKFAVKDFGKGKKKGVYVRAIRVLEHVAFQSADFAPLDEDDEFFAAEGAELSKESPDFEEDFGLDAAKDNPQKDDLDDVPFD